MVVSHDIRQISIIVDIKRSAATAGWNRVLETNEPNATSVAGHVVILSTDAGTKRGGI
jgi:hypothetical protein